MPAKLTPTAKPDSSVSMTYAALHNAPKSPRALEERCVATVVVATAKLTRNVVAQVYAKAEPARAAALTTPSAKQVKFARIKSVSLAVKMMPLVAMERSAKKVAVPKAAPEATPALMGRSAKKVDALSVRGKQIADLDRSAKTPNVRKVAKLTAIAQRVRSV